MPKREPLSAHLIVNDGHDYTWPELHLPRFADRADFGICLSGGGTRAFSAAMGQLRGLLHLGRMEQLRYISSVSGGSWANVIWSWGDPVDDHVLLGPMITPEHVNMGNLEAAVPRSCLGWPATHDLVSSGVAGLLGQGDLPASDAWLHAVGEVFLKPFGLYDPDGATRFTLDDETARAIAARPGNAHLEEATFHTLRGSGRPFPVINACAIGPTSLAPFEDDSPVHLEFTPLTAGQPFGCEVTFQGKGDGDPTAQLGGGLIEPFAFGGDAPTAIEEQGLCPTPHPEIPFTLMDAAGLSSMAPAAVMSGIGLTDGLVPRLPLWPVRAGKDIDARSFILGDGGVLENYGLLALLLRRVSKAIVFINTATPVNLELDLSKADPTQDDLDNYLPPLFGYPVSSLGVATQNNQVFPRSELAGLIDDLQATRRAGGAVWSRRKHTVQQNAWWGIPGGWTVEVLWVYLDQAPTWEARLGEDVQKALAASRRWMLPKDTFKDFPHYKTEGENGLHLVELTPAQIRLLADLTCWCVTELEAEITAMFEGSDRAG